MSNLIISEEQYNRLFEGIEYTSTGNINKPAMNFHINHSLNRLDNQGENNADTRMFNSAKGILKQTGDGKSVSEMHTFWKWAKDMMERARVYASNNGIGSIDFNRAAEWYQDRDINEVILKKLGKLRKEIFNQIVQCRKNGNNFQPMIKWIDLWFDRYGMRHEVNTNLYNRAKNYQKNTNKRRPIDQYRVGRVQGTNVKFIALFGIDDFNFSDALKHGQLRPNKHTKDIMGYEAKNKIPLTYDGNIPSNVENNFSQGEGVNDDHVKTQYQYGDENYTSQTMFIDKSIMYAAYALDKENYKPQYIIAAPSSSKFNHYYATSLANKLGSAEYIPDFYKRNLINFKNEQGIEIAEQMANDGIEESLITDFLKKVNNMALNEIASYVAEPIRDFINENYQIFADISAEHYSRERVDMKVLTRLVLNYTYNTMLKNTNIINENKAVPKYLLQVFYSYNKYVYGNDLYLIDEVRKRLRWKTGRREFTNILGEMWKRINETSAQLESKSGYKLRFNQPFKVTKLSKRTRPYLRGLYAVADKNFNENKQLFDRFTHANFLLIDEDLNSGTTLRNSIEALQDVMPEHNTSQMMCLTNAYSSGGF